MTTKVKIAIVFAAVVLLGTGFYLWKQGAPRRQAVAALNGLQVALTSPAPEALLQILMSPAAVRSRTAPEQAEFLRKALQDELSPEGIAVLGHQGQFGPLQELFPAEAEAWASQAGVKPEECIAFKLERNGLRAEVVLVKLHYFKPHTPPADEPYRIVRVNNVKQMADSTL
jgi:hypothetical protein